MEAGEIKPRSERTPAGVPFGRYAIRACLGRGGMGEVFLADQLGPLGPVRPVALKRLLPRLAGDAAALHLFLEEMGTAAQLNHPNIATTFDFGEVDGVYFLAMEYVEGATLDALLARQGPLPIPVALAIATRVADALEHAHERRGPRGEPRPVVHQDVSPHNVMLSASGAVKLLDFGIARAEAAVMGGNIRGKIAYAAPEQLRGSAPDRRFDVWGLGAALYESLTGARPFAGANAEEVLSAISGGLRKASTHRPELAALDDVLARALAPDPNIRYPSARALAEGCERCGIAPASQAELTAWAREVGARPRPTDLSETSATGVAALVPEAREAFSALQNARPRSEYADLGEADTVINKRPRALKRKPARRSAWTIAATAVALFGLGGAGVWWAQEASAPELLVVPIPEPSPPEVLAPAALEPAPTLPGPPTRPGPPTLPGPQIAPNTAIAPEARVAPDPQDPKPSQKGAQARSPKVLSRRRVGASPPERANPATPAAAEPAPPSKNELGVLSVRTTPWARVALDGEPIGEGIIAARPIAAGPHRVTLTPGEGGYPPRTVEIHIRPGAVTKVFADFAAGQVRVEPR